MKEIWKRFKQMGPRKVGSERGFTLIEMLIVMVIIAILLGGVIYAIGGFGGGAESTSYSLHVTTIENACLDYWVGHDYVYPVFDGVGVYYGNSTYDPIDDVAGQGTDNCGIVDLCLLSHLGYFEVVPSSATSAGTHSNCDGTLFPCSECTSTSHYVFYWNDTDEKVVTVCLGTACTSNVLDGYQDVWP